MTDLEKLDHILMLAYIRGRKNESVKFQKFNEAAEWRTKEVEMQPMATEICKEFAERRHLEELIDLDDKDVEIQRLKGIIKQLQDELVKKETKEIEDYDKDFEARFRGAWKAVNSKEI